MNVEEREKVIASAIFHCNFGKRTLAKEVALELTQRKTPDEYREQAKEALLWLALNNPERLREIAKALCWLKGARKRDKCPRGHDLVWAYATCAFAPGASFPPTLSEIKHAFIAWFGEKKWNGGHDDDQSHGDSSARKTLKILGLPLKEMKKGRLAGSKSLSSRPQGLKLDPEWDPLRGDPRFEQIVASLAPKDDASPAK
jgi:hypothetical protein